MNRATKVVLLMAMFLTVAITAFCDQADDYVASGRAKLAKRDMDGAIADFTKAIQLEPALAVAYLNRGRAKAVKGDLDGAIADSTKAIEFKPDDKFAYILRGSVKHDRGDLEGAIADYTKVIQLKPDDTFAYVHRGDVKRDKGDFEGAIADSTKAIELKPDDAFAYVDRGNEKRLNGDVEGAIADFTTAIEVAIEAESAYGYFGRGEAKKAKGDMAGASADYAKANQLDRNVAAVYNKIFGRKISWGPKRSYTCTSDVTKETGKGRKSQKGVVELTVEFQTDGPLTPFDSQFGTQPEVIHMSYGDSKYSAYKLTPPTASNADYSQVAESAVYALDPATQMPSKWRFMIDSKSSGSETRLESNTDGSGFNQIMGMGGSKFVLLTALSGTKCVWHMTP